MKKEAEEKLAITFFQADKADAILFQTAEGAVLMDTGLSENSEELLEQLEERGVERLEAMIITHFDQDHVGGADTILENMETDQVYVSYECRDSDNTDAFFSALAGAGLTADEVRGTRLFTLGGAEFTIFGASGSYHRNTSNNSSLITAVVFGENTYLFAGDAEDERIHEFLTGHRIYPDFLKVPYHGRYTDGLVEMANALSPQAAVITNSPDNPVKKELKKTISLLRENDIDVWQTKDGTITVTCTYDTFTITQ